MKEEKIMKFCWTTVTVKNMEESLKFYTEVLGLRVDRRYKAGPDMELAFLGDGETKLELICNEKIKEVSIGKDISVGFEVESADEMIAYLKGKDIVVFSGPFQPNEHIKFFFILDPNGLKVQLVEHIK